MASLGPFEPAPRIAVAVSGGADSLALALLAARWATGRAGSVLGLIVDHGLRPEAAGEAATAARALAGRGIASRVLRLDELRRGPGLAERARHARYGALTRACAEAGIVHLLLGHHAADQAETVLIRALGRSGPAGSAGMAALVETHALRLLRPLLPVAPVRLRATLRHAGLAWSEDPSNADPAALRPRLRRERRDPDGDGPATRALCEAAAADGAARARGEAEIARVLAEVATIRPEGFALLQTCCLPEAALSALLRTVGGRGFPPDRDAVARLAGDIRPATLAGVEVRRAGRLGPGFLLLREAAAMEPPVPARDGATWDGRFRITVGAGVSPGAMLGALGADAARLRTHSALPASVLRTVPALRVGGALAAVPAIGYADRDRCRGVRVGFCPALPASCAPFVPAAALALVPQLSR